MSELVAINGEGQPNKAAEELRKLRGTLAVVIEAQTVCAQITRAKYEALMAQGFTAAEALELCK